MPLSSSSPIRQPTADEPRDTLPLVEAELVETVGEAAEESFEGGGKLDVGLGVSSIDAIAR